MRTSRITSSVDETMSGDLLIFNNPVLMQGLALTPVVAAAITLKNAALLSIAAFVLIIPTRIIGELLIKRMPKPFRVFIYALVSALLYIPALMLLNYLFSPVEITGPGNFLPVLIVDAIVLSRAETSGQESFGRALINGLLTALAMTVVLLFVGLVRELLVSGTIWDNEIAPPEMLIAAGTVAGGLILVALMCAFIQWIGLSYKVTRVGGNKTDG